MDDLTRRDSPTAAGDDYQHALARGFLPIRDVARLTAVNAVTLRAWERRYGLIVPHRTPKGHRLYSGEHVAQIQTILTWLNRGVSVGQVKGLLRANQPALAAATSQWDEKCQRLQDAVCNLPGPVLKQRVGSLPAAYPVQTAAAPARCPGTALARPVRRPGRTGILLLLAAQQARRAALPQQPPAGRRAPAAGQSFRLADEAGAVAHRLAGQQYGSAVDVFDWPVPPAELAMVIEQIRPKALLLYSSQALHSAHWPRLQADYACPCLVIDPAAHIHYQELQALTRQNSALGIAPDPLSALHILSARNLLDNQ